MTESKSYVERRLIAFTHMEDYLTTFIDRWNSPSARLTALSAGLEEVTAVRMVMMAERMDGVPTIRKRRSRKSSE